MPCPFRSLQLFQFMFELVLDRNIVSDRYQSMFVYKCHVYQKLDHVVSYFHEQE